LFVFLSKSIEEFCIFTIDDRSSEKFLNQILRSKFRHSQRYTCLATIIFISHDELSSSLTFSPTKKASQLSALLSFSGNSKTIHRHRRIESKHLPWNKRFRFFQSIKPIYSKYVLMKKESSIHLWFPCKRFVQEFSLTANQSALVPINQSSSIMTNKSFQ